MRLESTCKPRKRLGLLPHFLLRAVIVPVINIEFTEYVRYYGIPNRQQVQTWGLPEHVPQQKNIIGKRSESQMHIHVHHCG